MLTGCLLDRTQAHRKEPRFTGASFARSLCWRSWYVFGASFDRHTYLWARDVKFYHLLDSSSAAGAGRRGPPQASAPRSAALAERQVAAGHHQMCCRRAEADNTTPSHTSLVIWCWRSGVASTFDVSTIYRCVSDKRRKRWRILLFVSS